MTDALAISLHDLAESTGASQDDIIDLGEAGDRTGSRIPTAAALKLALYGTVTGELTVTIRTSPDETNWRDVFEKKIASLDDACDIALGELDRYVRASWAVNGTTSIFWSLLGTAEVVYCEPSDVGQLAIDAFVLADFTREQVVRGCISCTGDAVDWISGAYELPLTAWGASLRKRVAQLVPAFLMRMRGCDETGADKKVFDTEKAALTWFGEIKAGVIAPPDIIDSTPDDDEGGSFINTNDARGWGDER